MKKVSFNSALYLAGLINEEGEGMPGSDVGRPYTQAARPIAPGGFAGTIQIGQAKLTVTGQLLQIDTGTHSIALTLTSQQLGQLQAELQ